MNLNQLAFIPRKRTAWQVFDLTLLLVRKHFFMMFKIVCGLYVPLFILFSLCFSPYVASFLLWWLKPVIERPLVAFLAKASFSQQTTVRSCLSSIKQLKLIDIFMMLTVYRLSPNRAYLAPIAQLEKLSGKQRSSRNNILLARADHKQSFWIIFCIHLELILSILFVAIVFNFIPQGVDVDLQFTFQSFDVGYLEQIYYYCYALAILIVMPYFVTGGFLSYLNGRIKLEGWDIELAFKRIINSKLTAVVMVLSLMFNPLSFSELEAKEQALQSENKELTPAMQMRTKITSLYEEHEWIKKETIWQPTQNNKKNDTDLSWLENLWFFKYIGSLLGYIAWGVVALFILWLGKLIYRYRGKFFSTSLSQKKIQKRDQSTEIPMFFDVLSEQVQSSDLLQLARKEKELQNFRSALMYILRYSLFFAEQVSSVTLHKSMSEKECLRALLSMLPSNNHELYSHLFNIWIQQAWAHKEASTEQVNDLINAFEQLTVESKGDE